jgi:hypothetical protein
MILSRAVPFVFVLSSFACAAADVDTDAPIDESELRTSDLDVRGALTADACVHTAGARTKAMIALSFNAIAGQAFDIAVDGYANPELRILAESGKVLSRGRKSFEGDGDTGGFVSRVRFVAPSKGEYYIAFRDRDVAAGEALPNWVRPSVSIDDVATRKHPSSCLATR